MSETTAALSHLHQLRQDLQRVTERKEQGPRRITAKQAYVAKRKQELETARQRVKQLRHSADQKNLQLKTHEAKIADLKAKLNAAASNREYDILRGQIEADTMAKSVLEDEILETLEQVDEAQAATRDAEQHVAAAEEELKKTSEGVAAELPGLDAELVALQEKVGAAERFLPANVIDTYRRLVEAFGADALAPVESKACGSCYVGLTMQQILELKTGKLLFCKSCGRLMYLSPE
ncbi:MAG: hypothetical protein KF777_09805 [Planctomycetaceae bacterium]|jgi:predicted  nucleic acid-binding Zn-ribbon protein|nr:hypothetical protein [Planctomycetaceae bacterium]